MEAALHARSLLVAGLLQPLSENSRPGHQLSTVALYPGIGFVNSNTATGLRVCLYDDRIGSRDTSKERDQESGLDYFEARYYGSALGRFTSPDEPLVDQHPSNPQSWNLYGFVRNNPLRYTDPTGNECVNLDNGSTGDNGVGKPCAGSQTPQTVNVNSQGGNRFTAFLWNTFFAATNIANSSFRFIAPDSKLLSDTPTNDELSGQLAEATAFIGTMVIGAGEAKVGLKLIHSPETLSKTILDGLRKKTTQELIDSLKPGMEEALRAKPDGRVMNGNHRITVLIERGVNVDALPREVVK